MHITLSSISTKIPHAEPFLHLGSAPSYKDILKESFNWESYDFLFLDDDDNVVGGGRFAKIGDTLVSMPHMSLGHWWCDGDDTEAFNLLGKYAKETLGVRNIEVRSLVHISMHYDNNKMLSVMDLCDDTSIDNIISSNLRRKIHKAHNSGVYVKKAEVNKENIDDFFKIYHKKIHQLHSFPVTKKYIYTLLKEWKDGEVLLFFVNINNKRVGAAINISYNTFTENIILCTDPKYYNYYITDALHYAMIKHAIKSGMQQYSFGRSTFNSKVYKYKNHWPLKNYPIYRNFNKPIASDLRYSTSVKKICKLIPIKIRTSLASIVSKIIY